MDIYLFMIGHESEIKFEYIYFFLFLIEKSESKVYKSPYSFKNAWLSF